MSEQATTPAIQLKTNRGWLKTILLSIITFGIYSIVMFSGISSDINTIAGRYDGKKTMHYCLLFFLIAPITGGIAAIVWTHRLSARIGRELTRRELPYSFGAGSFWGWGVLGAFLFGIGPIIYLHKLCKSMNILSANFNING